MESGTEELERSLHELNLSDEEFAYGVASFLFSEKYLTQYQWSHFDEHEDATRIRDRENIIARDDNVLYRDLPDLVEDWSDEEDWEVEKENGNDADDEHVLDSEFSDEPESVRGEETGNQAQEHTSAVDSASETLDVLRSSPSYRRAYVEDVEDDGDLRMEPQGEEEEIGFIDEDGYIRQPHSKLSGKFHYIYRAVPM